jgi:hypothetical protein
MNGDVHPELGVFGGALFIGVGVLALFFPAVIANIAQRSHDAARVKWPFADFASDPRFVPAARVLGALAIVAGLFLLVGSVMAL